MNFPRVLVVIPALNEAASIGSVIERTLMSGYECLVIDDGSTDETAQIAKRSGAYVVSLPFNLGIGGALRCGFKWAVEHGYDSVVQCDADGQHSPELIERLVTAHRDTGADLVIGSRFRDTNTYKVGLLRGLLMRRMAAMVSGVTGQQMTDTTSGFRCISGALLGEFALSYPAEYMESFEALVVAAKSGYSVTEVPCEMSHGVAGIPSHRPVRAAGFTIRVLLSGLAGTRFSIKPKPKN